MTVTAKTQSSSATSDYTALIHESLSYDTIGINALDYPCPNEHASLKNPVSPTTHMLYLPRSQSGFTLVEIVVVVVILSIFAGMMSLSVGSSESRKNRAFYEHLTDSLSYVRLLSAERMQPMGLSLQADKQA